MKLEELHPMVEVIPNDIQSCHDRIESLEDRLQIAKHLLIGTYSERRSINWSEKRAALIDKLSMDGL